MKKILSRLTLITCLAALFVASGCNRDKENAFSVSIKEVGPGYVDLYVTSPLPVIKLAYDLSSTEKNVTNKVSLFADAKKGGRLLDVKDGEIVRISDGVEQDTKYFLYLVAELTEEYSDIKTLTFSTSPYDFDELLTVVATNYDGYKMHVTIPESAEAAGNAIRFNQCCLMMYNYARSSGNDDYFSLLYNAGAYAKKDTTLVYSEETNWYQTEQDADGDGTYDWENRFNPISPGEPVVFVAGEFSWMEDSPEYETEFFKFPSGWENGYYMPLLDTEYYKSGKSQSSVGVLDIDLSHKLDPYWKGAFQRKVVMTRQPSLLDAKVNIEYANVGPVNATVIFTPEEGVEQYAFGIMDAATYNQMMDLLMGNEDYLQWAITSYFAAYTLGTGVANSPMQIQLSDMFYDVPSETDIYVMVTAMGDDRGTTQSFNSLKFSTTAKVLDAPVVTVTPVESKTTPTAAAFNVKSDMPLVRASYGANYVRDWKLETNGGASYYDLVSNAFSADDIEKICSKDGLDVIIPSVDGETTRLVVVGYNEENTPNNLNFPVIEECPAVADVTTPYSDPKPYVPSELYEKLCGEWTATATLYNGTKEFPHKSKIVISRHDEEAGIVAFDDYPTELPDSVYTIYKEALKKDNYEQVKEIVDGYYADFLKRINDFGLYRLQDQNRLLCQGWLDKDSYNRLGIQTPYELFVSKKYSSVDVSSIFFDFGPKWYIEISKDASGNVVLSAPIDANFLPPAANWSVPFYFGGYDKKTTYMFLYGTDHTPMFPIELKDDNTFVMKPIVREDGTFYPNMVGVDSSQGGYIFENPVVSEITFTRGWTEETGKKQSSLIPSLGNVHVNAESPTSVVKPMTRLRDRVSYTTVEGSVMTLDKFKSNADRLMESLKK